MVVFQIHVIGVGALKREVNRQFALTVTAQKPLRLGAAGLKARLVAGVIHRQAGKSHRLLAHHGGINGFKTLYGVIYANYSPISELRSRYACKRNAWTRLFADTPTSTN
jgi:hypothetical protein